MILNWETEPVGPFRFAHGIIDPHGGVHVLQQQFDVTLERGVELFAAGLPSKEGTWAYVTNVAEHRIIARKHGLDGTIAWAGVRVAFDELEKHCGMDAVWWGMWAMAVQMETET